MTSVGEAINPGPNVTTGGEQWSWEEITIDGKTKKKLNFVIQIYSDNLYIIFQGKHTKNEDMVEFMGPIFIIQRNDGHVSKKDKPDGNIEHFHHFNTENQKCARCDLKCKHEYIYDNYCLFCGESGFENNIDDIIDFIMNYYNEENHEVSIVNTKQHNNRPTIRKLKTLIEDLKKDPDNTKNIIEIEKYIKKLK